MITNAPRQCKSLRLIRHVGVVVVVVEWLYHYKRIIIVRWADLSDFSSIFVGKMCVFVSRPMKIATFLRKNVTPQNGLLIFLRKETHSEKIMEIVKDFDEKSYNNNGKPWKSSRILRLIPFFSFFFPFFNIFPYFFVFHFFTFSCFFHFSMFFFFFIFCIFSFFYISFFSFFHFFFIFHFSSFSYHFLSCSFIFFHFLSFSVIFCHFLSCSFIVFHCLSLSFIFFHFLSLSFIVFHCLSLSLLGAQINFWAHLGWYPIWALLKKKTFFLFFGSFLHFLIFLSFSFSFLIFQKKKFILLFFVVFLSKFFIAGVGIRV